MKYKHLNNLLLSLIILVNAYVILTPLWPQLVFHSPTARTREHNLTVKIHSQPQAVAAPTKALADNLTVPSMQLDQPVLEGSDIYAVLNRGILHWPASSTPDKGGNTVLLGHRFTYHVPRGVFYFLDKVSVGDEIGLTWNNRRYLYKVREVKTVPPNDTAIEAPTSDDRLTLFTCTPLYWPEYRLVVIASLESA